MTEALPNRILLPLANPRTAADLVKIGADLSRGKSAFTPGRRGR